MVLKKIACVVGIIAYLLATLDLVNLGATLFFRFGHLRHSYFILAILAIPYIFLFVRAWKGTLTDYSKWVGVAVSVGGIYLMMRSPINLTILVVSQVLFLLFVSSACLMFVGAQKDFREFPRWGKYILVSGYIFLMIISMGAFYLPGRDGVSVSSMISNHASMARPPVVESRPVESLILDDAENDLNFRWILPPVYYSGRDFYWGRTWVREERGGPWKLVDSDGNIIKRDFVADIVWHESGRTAFTTLERDRETGWNMYGELDRYSGEIISGPKPFRTSPFFQYGLSTQTVENGLRGFIDFQGNWVIPPRFFESVSLWSEGLIAVKNNGKWGYMNREGEIVIDFQFEDAFRFSNGLAAVSLNLPLYGLIDREGNWVAEPVYERFFFPFSNLIGAQRNGRIGFLDTEGNVAIDFKFAGIDIPDGGASPAIDRTTTRAVFHGGRAVVPVFNNRLVVINESGEIIPTEHDDLSRFSGGFAVAVRDRRLFMLDKYGREFSLPSDLQSAAEVGIGPAGDDGIFRARVQRKVGYFRVGN